MNKDKVAFEPTSPVIGSEWSSGADGVPVGLDRGVLAVDFLSSQAYKIPIMIPRDR
jgi:hypothetical protein